MALSVTLTDDQLDQVEDQELDAEDLPEYYNAVTQSQVQISRDFEAFLILSSIDMKTSAIDWIKKSATLQQTNKDRDDLVAMALTQEATNAQLKIDALNAALGDFETFRNNFQASMEFSTVQEVQLFLADLQKVIGEKAAALDRATFDATTSQVIQTNGDPEIVTDDDIEELQSWTGVISTYLQG